MRIKCSCVTAFKISVLSAQFVFCNTIKYLDERNYVCVLQSLCPAGVCSISNFDVEPFLRLYMRLILLGGWRAFNMKTFFNVEVLFAC